MNEHRFLSSFILQQHNSSKDLTHITSTLNQITPICVDNVIKICLTEMDPYL